jgi:hypothetical protein
MLHEPAVTLAERDCAAAACGLVIADPRLNGPPP